MSADLLRGHLDRLLLAVLADAPGHGYELSQRLIERSGGELDVHEGSLYPALHRLERGGLVESSWSTGDGRRLGPRWGCGVAESCSPGTGGRRVGPCPSPRPPRSTSTRSARATWRR